MRSDPKSSGPAPLKGMEIACSRGRHLVSVGDEFEDNGMRWRVEAFVGQGMYSPSGFGGTPTLRCRHIAGHLAPGWFRFMKDGCCDWCGDSVASNLMREAGHVWQR